MNVLLIGQGGREHALAWKFKQSKLLSNLYAYPGSDAINQLTEPIDDKINSHDDIVQFCRNKSIELVVVGPEQPLAEGLVDLLQQNNIMAFGPNKAAAHLESSKIFTKQVCEKGSIPTAKRMAAGSSAEIISFLEKQNLFPMVIKQDSLAAGKGVLVAHNKQDAIQFVSQISASTKDKATFMIEECLIGREASVFALVKDNRPYLFYSSQDYKTVGENGTGINTGGMGTFSPGCTPAETTRIMQDIIEPSLKVLSEMNISYTGILFAGIMLTESGPKLLEYNVRFGDPETQSMLPLMESDLLENIMNIMQDRDPNIKFSSQKSVCVVMAAKGYPINPIKGSVIKGLENINQDNQNIIIFHAGTKKQNNQWIANGGRVLNIVATANTVEEARNICYKAIQQIDWPEGFYRHDIAKDIKI